MMAARWHAAPRPSGGLPRAESGRRCAPVRSHSPSPFPTSPGGVCSMPEHRSQSHLSAKSAWPSAPCASARRGTISDPPQPQVVPDTSAPASANLADLAESLPDNDCRYAGVPHLHQMHIRLRGAQRRPCSPPSALAFRRSVGRRPPSLRHSQRFNASQRDAPCRQASRGEWRPAFLVPLAPLRSSMSSSQPGAFRHARCLAHGPHGLPSSTGGAEQRGNAGALCSA